MSNIEKQEVFIVCKPFIVYTQAEKVKFINQYRELLTIRLGRKVSDFDLVSYYGEEDFQESLIKQT